MDLNEVIKEGGRGSSGTSRRGRSALLVAEVSLSMVLLVGAGLMMRGFLREQSDLPGFDTQRLLVSDVLLGGTKYFDKTPQDMNLVTPHVEAFFDQVLERVRALPGVKRAGIISRLPTELWRHPFAIVGKPAPEPGRSPAADVNEVDAQLLDTLGIRLLRGREIEERDVASAPWVAVVNKTFADRHFPNRIRSARRSASPWAHRRRPQRDGGAAGPRDRGGRGRRDLPELLQRAPGRGSTFPFRQHVWQYRAGRRVAPHAQGPGRADLGGPAVPRARDRGLGDRRSTATRPRTTS